MVFFWPNPAWFWYILVLPVSEARLQWITMPTAFFLWLASSMFKLVRNQSYFEPGMTPQVVKFAQATTQWLSYDVTSLARQANHRNPNANLVSTGLFGLNPEKHSKTFKTYYGCLKVSGMSAKLSWIQVVTDGNTVLSESTARPLKNCMFLVM